VSDQARRADALRALHVPGDPLVLVNAWDVASARTVAAHPACRAVATGSAGVAGSLGWGDGEQMPVAEALAAVGRIARAVDLPLTADLEAGYGDAGATAAGAIAAGAVGMNLEDADHAGGPGALVDLDAHAAAVARAVAAGAAAGVGVVVNARTDVFLRDVGDPGQRVALAAARLNAYLAAGAVCGFAPGVTDPVAVGELVRAVDGPVSVLAAPGAPSVAELAALGVARISLGSRPFRAALAATAAYAAEVHEHGTWPA
jgi:2-methylisocitrate lyase-like PEP mutase family enzyme